MGTRSITHIHQMTSLGNEIVCTFFRHWDGYPSGHGKDLLLWLKGKNLVNGISAGFREGVDFNRAGTMAVKLMNHIQDVSGCEVIPTGSDDCGEDYTYHIGYDSKQNKFFLGIKQEYDGGFAVFSVDETDPDIFDKEDIFDQERMKELGVPVRFSPKFLAEKDDDVIDI